MLAWVNLLKNGEIIEKNVVSNVEQLISTSIKIE